jgi:hypothetical protein
MLEGNRIQNRKNENIPTRGQGRVQHRKYKKCTFGGGQAYGRSSD